jgi:hypothetical protein
LCVFFAAPAPILPLSLRFCPGAVGGWGGGDAAIAPSMMGGDRASERLTRRCRRRRASLTTIVIPDPPRPAPALFFVGFEKKWRTD